MSDDTNQNEETEVMESELEALKLRADQMGVSYHPNIGSRKLREKIEAAEDSSETDTDFDLPKESEIDSLKARADQMGLSYHPKIDVASLREKVQEAVSKNTPYKKPVESEAQRRSKHLKEAGRLRRIRVTCMNPMKAEWEGEIFTAGNGVIGNFKKYVPFEVEWHVPQIILDMMEQRKYQSFYTVTDPKTGQKGRKGKMSKEFAIQMLPDLTEEELKNLAQRQAMAQGTAEG